MNIFTILVIMLTLFFNGVAFATPLKIVASIPTFASLVKEIGGDFVEVSSVASPKFNPHFIEPRPTDILRLKKADLFVHGGLDLEAWRGPLVDAVARSDFRQGGVAQLDLSLGVELLEIPTKVPLRSEGDIHLFGNPHYWLSPRNGIFIGRNITKKLSEMMPENAVYFQDNFAKFSSVLTEAVERWHTQMKSLAGREFIGYHNEWIYLTTFLGIKMDKFLEPKPGVPPTPRQVESLIKYGEKIKLGGVIQPSFYSIDASKELASKLNVPLFILPQGVGEIDGVDSYLDIFEYVVTKLSK